MDSVFRPRVDQIITELAEEEGWRAQGAMDQCMLEKRIGIPHFRVGNSDQQED